VSQEEDFISELNRTDPWIAAITPERIERAMGGFPLPLSEGRNWAHLARQIQDVAIFSRGQTPQGDAEAKAELGKLANKAKALRLGIERMGGTATFAAFFDVLQREEERRGAKQIDWDSDYAPLMLHSLQAIEDVLARAASQIATQQKQVPGWQKKVAQERRVGFAIHLSAVFEDAFGAQAKSHNWAADFGKEHPWREFYRRIYSELFPEAERLNLGEVLQQAAQLRQKLEAVTRQLEQDATRPQNNCE
jgi:hypothetical protein